MKKPLLKYLTFLALLTILFMTVSVNGQHSSSRSSQNTNQQQPRMIVTNKLIKNQ